jgi:carbamoyltransferase
VLAERASEWFDLQVPAPYMLLTAQVRSAQVEPSDDRPFAERLASVKSPIPACTHVDGSARVQTVHDDRTPAFHGLLVEFERLTGCPVLLNTSFNRADEPIVRTPADAYRCFVAAGLDLLVLGRCVVAAPHLEGSPRSPCALDR